MSAKELLEEFKELDTETLKEIADNPNATFQEILVASKVITDREIENGECYTMEEVFGKRNISNTIN